MFRDRGQNSLCELESRTFLAVRVWTTVISRSNFPEQMRTTPGRSPVLRIHIRLDFEDKA